MHIFIKVIKLLVAGCRLTQFKFPKGTNDESRRGGHGHVLGLKLCTALTYFHINLELNMRQTTRAVHIKHIFIKLLKTSQDADINRLKQNILQFIQRARVATFRIKLSDI